MAFHPLFPAHAIERCTAGFYFNQPLPSKLFKGVLASSAAAFRNFGLEPTGVPSIQIDGNGAVGAISGPSATNYLSADRSTGLLVTPQSVQFQTARYVRWAPFIGQFEDLAFPLIRRFAESVSLMQLQLDYLDTFLWDGTWDDFRSQDLLIADSGFISPVASRASRQWHTHSGWFEDVTEHFRRLVVANIDVVDRLRSGETPGVGPAITITTLMREDAFSPLGEPEPEEGLPIDESLHRLQDLHSRLKMLLQSIIKPEMADRVGLG